MNKRKVNPLPFGKGHIGRPVMLRFGKEVAHPPKPTGPPNLKVPDPAPWFAAVYFGLIMFSLGFAFAFIVVQLV